MPSKKKVKKRIAKKRVVVKKKTAKKQAVKKVSAKKKVGKAVKRPKENVVGTVTHYFPHVQAAVVKLKSNLSVGDNIKIKGHTTDFTQTITSMQMDHVSIDVAKKGQEIGLMVTSRVRQHDKVIKI